MECRAGGRCKTGDERAKKMKKSERERIHQMYGGRCAYCGCGITVKSMHVDHVEAVFRETCWDNEKHRWVATSEMWRGYNDRPENLFPSCAPCNLWKHAMSLEDFRESVMTQIDKIRKTSCGFRLLERFGIISVNEIPNQFYFEKVAMIDKDNPESLPDSDMLSGRLF